MKTAPPPSSARPPWRFAVVLATLAVVSALTVAAYGVYAWHRVQEEAADRLAGLARLGAESSRLFYDNIDGSLAVLARRISEDGAAGSPAKTQALLERYNVRSGPLRAMQLITPDGRVVADSIQPRIANWNPAADPTAIHGPASDLEIGRPLPGDLDEPKLIPVRYPVRNSRGRLLFTLAALVSTAEQTRILSELQMHGTGTIGVVRDDGVVQDQWRAGYNQGAWFPNPVDGVLAATLKADSDQSHGRIPHVEADSTERRLMAFHRIPGYPLALVLAMPSRAIWTLWLERVQVPVFLLLCMAMAGVIIGRRATAQQSLWSREVDQRQSRLELLHRMATLVNAGLPVTDVIERTVASLSSRYPALRITYSTLDERGRLVVIESMPAPGLPDATGYEIDYAKTPEYLAVLRAGGPGLIENWRTDPRIQALQLPDLCLAAACLDMPLAHPGALIGLLSLDSAQPRVWGADEVDTLREVASQLALALREAQAQQARVIAVEQLSDRESTFRQLAEISSDWFWEQDTEARFRLRADAFWLTPGPFGSESSFIGAPVWDLPDTRFDADQLAAHRNVLSRREAFRDFEFEQIAADGSPRHLSLSGIPVFDPDGTFVGYQGVGRDVTGQNLAALKLRESEATFAAVFNSSRDALFVGNIRDGSVSDCNPRAVELFAAQSKQSLLRRPGHSLLRHPLSRSVLADRLQRMGGGEILQEDLPFRSRAGRVFWGEMVAVELQLPGPPNYLVRVADISERKEAETRLRASEQRFRDLTELSSDWFWEMDEELRFTEISASALHGFTQGRESPIGKRRWELPYILDQQDPKWELHRRTLAAHKPFRDFVYRYHSMQGMRWSSISGRPLFDDNGTFAGYRGIGTDITERKMSEDRIRYLAQHDELTGLPNRTAFQQSVSHAIEQSRRYDRKIAVFFVDLDRFKHINDTLGHDAGDTVLKEVALRLRGCLRAGDVVARQGGDEFVVLVEEFVTETDLTGIARKMMEAFAQPFFLGGQEFLLTASVGIGTFPLDGNDIQSLLKAADIAMYRAKESGKNNFQFYAPQMNVHTFERLALQASLKRALERNELRLFYQPKLELATRRITGMEALLRWDHPEMGLVPPMQFIPIAEETGLITPIETWVMREACRQAKAWERAGLRDLKVAVNLSGRQFLQDSLLEEVVSALDDAGLDARYLELEITESTVMQKPELAAGLLGALDELGVSIAIDDFGTGYSSLAYLQRFPVDVLKIDRSFIKDLPDDPDNAAITRAVIALARSLKLEVVAEGVEQARQLEYLAAQGCDQAQGFFIGKPMSATEFEHFMREIGCFAA